MGVIIRESLKSSIVNYIGVVIGTVNVLFLYNKLFTTEEYGLYAIILSFPIVAAGFINLGIPHVCVRFFNHFADTQKKYYGLFTWLLLVPLVGIGIFIIAFYGLRDWFDAIYKESPMLIDYAWVLPLLTLFVLYQYVLEAYCKVHLKVLIPVIIREICLKLSNTLLVILYHYEILDFTELLIGLVIVYAFAVAALLIYIKYLKRFFIVWDWSIIKSPVFPEMLKYGLWTMLGGAAATTLPHLEKQILPMFANGLTSTAVFTIALNIAIVISIPRNTIANISEPILAKAWAVRDMKEIRNIYSKSALNLSIIGLFLLLGIWVNIDNIFEIIPNSEKYSSGKYVVLLIGLSNVFDMATGLNSELLKNSPYYKVDFTAFIIRFLILTLANIILIPLYSYNGAAAAILVSTVFYNIFKYMFIWYKFHIQPLTIKTLTVLGLAVLAYGVCFFIDWSVGNSLFMNLVEIAIKSLIIIIIFGGGVLLFRVSEDLNSTLMAISTRIISK